MLVFDSLNKSRKLIVNHVEILLDYFSNEYQKKNETNLCFTKRNINVQCMEVPQQPNLNDCGVYVLKYLECFFEVR